MPKDRKAKRASMRDRVKQHAKDSRKGSKLLNLPVNVEVWFPDEKGVFEIDILPYVVTDKNHPDDVEAGELWYRRPYWIHFIERKPVVCPRSVGKPCPICEEVERLSKDYDANKEIISAIKRREQCLFNFVDAGDKKKTIKIMDWSSFKFAQELEHELDETEDKDDCGFADLDGGSTIKFRVSDSDFQGAKFFKTTRLDFRRPRPVFDEDILEKVVDLDTVLKIKSYEELAKLLFGSDEDDDDDEKPVAKKSSKKEPAPKKGKAAKAPEPEEDDEDEDDDEDWEDDKDEEPAPKKGKAAKAPAKKGKAAKAPEPEEDDDEDWEDEDEDEDEDDDEDWEEEEDDDEDDEDEDSSDDEEDDEDEDWDDEDSDDDEDDDEEELEIPTKKEVKGMNKQELLDVLEGPLKGKHKKTATALKRMALSELRTLVAGLV